MVTKAQFAQGKTMPSRTQPRLLTPAQEPVQLGNVTLVSHAMDLTTRPWQEKRFRKIAV